MLGALLCVVWALCCHRDIIGTILTCDRPCRCIALQEIPPGIETVLIRSPLTNKITTARGGRLVILDQRKPYAGSDSDRTFCTEGVTAVVRGKEIIYCEVQSTPMTDMDQTSSDLTPMTDTDPTSSGLTISPTSTLPHTTVWSSHRLESSFASVINPTEPILPSTVNEPMTMSMTSIKPASGDSELTELALDVTVILVMVPVLTILVIFILVVVCCKGCRCATTYSTTGTTMRPSSVLPDSPEQSPSTTDGEEDPTSLYPFVNKYAEYPIKEPRIVMNNFGDIRNYFGIAKDKNSSTAEVVSSCAAS